LSGKQLKQIQGTQIWQEGLKIQILLKHAYTLSTTKLEIKAK
jgi:hypothetical protein